MKTSLHSLVLSVCVVTLALGRVGAQEYSAYAVADAITGHILASDNAAKKRQIGSLAKIATAMTVLDWAEFSKNDLGTMATVPRSAAKIAGTNPVGLMPGDKVSLRDLLYAALLQSDNVAAYTLAVHVGRSLPRDNSDATPEELFVARMNALARKLGMMRTVFLNSHGLDDHEHPYSTAADLVLLTRYAMGRADFRFYVSQQERHITRHTAEGATVDFNLVNTNELLGKESVDGVKTGRTDRAGECLILSSSRAPESTKNPDGSITVTPQRLILVLLGAHDRFRQGADMLARGWELYAAWAADGRPLEKKQ